MSYICLQELNFVFHHTDLDILDTIVAQNLTWTQHIKTVYKAVESVYWMKDSSQLSLIQRLFIRSHIFLQAHRS